jgi:UDP-N-acetylglucosamine 2-epimerase
VAHVEAGLRSFNKAMPEEVNRVLTDHVSDLLFCPTETAVENLATEGITEGVHHTGDVMYDAVLYYADIAEERSAILDELELGPDPYLLATVHRPRNTDDASNLRAILNALSETDETVIFPAHPRTQEAVDAENVAISDNVRVIEPVGYLDILQLERHARMILTDSGGIQKEAYFFGVPCVTLREETEWVETVEAGWNVLVGAEKERILEAVRDSKRAQARPELFGDGRAAERFVRLLEETT